MKIYVGNLPWSVDDAKLKEMFSGFGDVEEASVIKDKFKGRSKGFGFVTISDDDSAKKAIDEMNGKEMEGRKLTVNEAKPMDPDAPRRPRRDFGGRDFGGRSQGGSRGGSRGGFGGGRRF